MAGVRIVHPPAALCLCVVRLRFDTFRAGCIAARSMVHRNGAPFFC